MLVQILRKFQGPRAFKIGEVVDASDWKWTDSLIANRYVAVVKEPAPAPKKRVHKRKPKKEVKINGEQ